MCPSLHIYRAVNTIVHALWACPHPTCYSILMQFDVGHGTLPTFFSISIVRVVKNASRRKTRDRERESEKNPREKKTKTPKSMANSWASCTRICTLAFSWKREREYVCPFPQLPLQLFSFFLSLSWSFFWHNFNSNLAKSKAQFDCILSGIKVAFVVAGRVIIISFTIISATHKVKGYSSLHCKWNFKAGMFYIDVQMISESLVAFA